MWIRRLLLSCVACLVTAPAFGELPAGLIWDDAFTWFDLSEDSILVEGKPKDQGWRLQYQFRMFGDTPQRSGFKLVISKDGTELGSLREEGKQKYPGREGFDWDKPLRMISQESLVNWKQKIVGTGIYDLEIFYIDGETQKEFLAREYKLDVRAAHRVRGVGANALTDGPHYYLNRHGDAAWSFVHLRPKGFPGYISGGGMRNSVVIYWHTVPREGTKAGNTVSGQTWINGRLRVKVDGEPLNLGSRPDQQQVVNDQVRQIWAVHTDRNTEEFHFGAEYKETIRFATYEAVLPLTWRDDASELVIRQASGSITYQSEPRPGLVAINDHPGRWDLEWIVNGETIRSWTFEVTDAGKIKPWDEAPEHITLHPFAQIIEMNIPDGGSSVDGRLTPEFVRDGAFHGLGLPKAFAKKVPKKGEPFPEFSGPYVAAVDPQTERRKEYEEAKAAREAAADASVAERKAEAESQTADIEAQRTPSATRDAQVSAEESVQDAPSQGSGALHLLLRILLSLGLVCIGMVLTANTLKEKVTPLARVVDALREKAGTLGLLVIGLAIVDFVLDFVALRPIVGDGLPQIAALAGGAIAAKSSLSRQAVIQKHEEKLAKLEGSSQTIGLICLIVGVLHLLLGGMPVL